MVKHLDCTLRDGGYYNNWDFKPEFISAYVKAMAALSVDVIEIGFRIMPDKEGGFKGGCAYCSDDYIRSLNLPDGIKLAVMVNASDLLKHPDGVETSVSSFFHQAVQSPVQMVRIATHIYQLEKVLPAVSALHDLGYKTTINLMQIAGLAGKEVSALAELCASCPPDVLYFADSLGGMVQDDVNIIVESLRKHWQGELGFHAHNNMEWALANSLRAIELGVNWIDSTVLGMGRGPGNTRTEYFVIELEKRFGRKMRYAPLMEFIDNYLKPMHEKYGWGPNIYYYMAGKSGIHPTYIQEMIGDPRYDGEDILAVIDHLSATGGKHYSLDNLEAARNFYSGEPRGTWRPVTLIEGREVVLLGTGPGVSAYREALENYIIRKKPFVMALNTQSQIDSELIDVRLACHPVRLLADCHEHTRLPQPLITPVSMLPDDVKKELFGKELFDFGLGVKHETFETADTYCIIPNFLVVAYALAVATSGSAARLLLAGFDGYGSDDPRNIEMNSLLEVYNNSPGRLKVYAVTPTKYKLIQRSIYEISGYRDE